jgi:hypothetical protein
MKNKLFTALFICLLINQATNAANGLAEMAVNDW